MEADDDDLDASSVLGFASVFFFGEVLPFLLVVSEATSAPLASWPLPGPPPCPGPQPKPPPAERQEEVDGRRQRGRAGEFGDEQKRTGHGEFEREAVGQPGERIAREPADDRAADRRDDADDVQHRFRPTEIEQTLHKTS